MKLNPDDPYLAKNIARLKKRFNLRLHDSIAKNEKRLGAGKLPHKSITESIQQNGKRLLMVSVIEGIICPSSKNQ
ncbi:MAG: hypothetical protein AAFN93_10010 [Bacteroidota bacterium]